MDTAVATAAMQQDEGLPPRVGAGGPQGFVGGFWFRLSQEVRLASSDPMISPISPDGVRFGRTVLGGNDGPVYWELDQRLKRRRKEGTMEGSGKGQWRAVEKDNVSRQMEGSGKGDDDRQ